MNLMKILCLLFLLIVRSISHPIKELNIDSLTIYAAEIKLPSGEIAYFAYEPIMDEIRSLKWERYRAQTAVHTDTIGFLRNIFHNRRDIVSLLTGDIQRAYDRIFPDSTILKEELWNLILNVYQQGKNSKMRDAMEGIYSGCLGFQPDQNNYVAYISKNPITGFFPLPEPLPEEDIKNLAFYMKNYENLVMVISSYDSKEATEFNHRGIFRNPISMLRQDYKNVALLLHSFAAYARSIAFPDSMFMYVNPDDNIKMEELLKNCFPNIQKETMGYKIPVDDLKSQFELILNIYAEEHSRVIEDLERLKL